MKEFKRSVEYLTKEQAQKMFDSRLELNRPLNKRHAESMTRDMDKGKWVYNGEPVRFNSKGELVDGQHRLRAFIDSTLEEIPMAIERNLSDEAFRVTDTGKKRSVANFFHMEGRSYAVQLAGSSRLVYLYMEHGNMADSTHPTTVSEQSEILDMFPELEHYVKAYSIQKLPIQMPAASLAAIHTLLRALSKSKTAADEFMNGLVQGESLEKNDPRLTARNYITRRSWGSQGISKSWLTDKFVGRAIAVIITAWNKWRAGESYLNVKPIKIFPVISK